MDTYSIILLIANAACVFYGMNQLDRLACERRLLSGWGVLGIIATALNGYCVGYGLTILLAGLL